MNNSVNPNLVILVVSLVTALIRFLPFIIFKNKVSKVIEYLGKKLPYAIMAMLVVYCLKDTSITTLNSIIPAIVGVISVLVIHLYKKNILLSIVLGTTIYMVLLNII